MYLYSCTVNLNGNSDNQVNLENVTAAEIRVLQHVHGRSENGKEPVINIEHMATTTRTDHQERQRLKQKYSGLELGQGGVIIEKLLGVPGVPLPQIYEPPVFVPLDDLPGEETPMEEVITPVEAAPKPKRTKVEAKQVEAAV